MYQNNLNVLRAQIDALDIQILSLLNKRFEYVLAIHDIKDQFNLPKQDKQREKEITETLIASNKGKLSSVAVSSLFKNIISILLKEIPKNKKNP